MLYNAIFSIEEIEKIKNSKNEKVQNLMKAIIAEADSALEKEDRATAQTLGFAYYATGDKKYFEKAKNDMFKLCEEECWTPGGLHGGSFTGRSELTSAAKSMYMAYGFDFFGDLLTEDELKKIADVTYEKGIKFIYEDWVCHETRIHALDTMGHNWWIVMVSSGAFAATIMKDYIPDGEKIARVSAECCKAWFEYKGNPVNAKPVNCDNGAFWEGCGYLNYSLNEYTSFANVYKNIFGEKPFNDDEILKKHAGFFLSAYYPTETDALFVDLGDAARHESLSSLYRFIRYGIDIPEARWFINNIKNQNDQAFLRIFITDELEKEEKVPEKLNVCYDKIGWAIFRDNYNNNGNMLAIKCGDTWNHAHADAGHFGFYKNGINEICEAGKPKSYGAQSYQGYYVQSIAHNTVLFNNKGQDYRDNYKDHARVPGKLVNFTDKDGFRYVMADCTGPMGRFFRKHHRHFLWLDKFILIYDDIECYEKGEVNFLLHAEDKNSFKMLTPCKERDLDGYKDSSDEFNCKYKAYDIETGFEDHAKFVSVICVDDSIEPTYEEFEKYIKITCGETKVYINLRSDGTVMHNNCLIQADEFVTDAVILTENNGKIGAVNGSIVRKNNETLLGVWARINGYIN